MGHSAARYSGKGAKIICLATDIYLTPVSNAIVPIPYMIVSPGPDMHLCHTSTRKLNHRG